MIKYLIFTLFLFCPLASQAQETSRAGLGFIHNYFPDLRLNEDHFKGASSYTIKINHYEGDFLPVEYGAHMTFGYHQTISFSYGLSFAIVMFPSKPLVLKAGASLDKVKMKETRSEFFIGGRFEDDSHESLKPFLELDIKLVKSLSLIFQASYRFFRSETEYVTDIVTKITESGSLDEYLILDEKQSYYGAGFNYGFGLQVNF